MRVICFSVLASLVCVSALKLGKPPPYFEQYLDQQVDHFNYEDDSTYKERYLVSGELRGSRIAFLPNTAIV